MILINRSEADYLIQNGMSKFIHVSSKCHKSKAKKYYLTENEKALKKLQDYNDSIVISRYE